MSGSATTAAELYRGGRKELDRAFARRRDPDAYVAGHTRLLDELIEKLQGAHPLPAGLALAATGGYGRRQLCPFSDIDLLFVYREELGADAEQRIKQLLHGLWDCGLRVGQQVWSLDQLDRRDEAPVEFLLSLLDVRGLSGDETLLARIGDTAELVRRDGDRLIRGLVELAESRHQSYGDTLYHLEPDVKETPGGLRDVQLIGWLKWLCGWEPDASRRVVVEEAGQLLSRLRIALHLATGRNDNRLSFPLQEEIAERWGLSGGGHRAGAESLMQSYFLAIRPLFRLSRRALAEAAGRRIDGFARGATDEDVLTDAERRLRRGRRMEGYFEGWQPPDGLPDFASLRKALRRLLQPRAGLYEALSELYEVGFLEHLLPEFGGIRARVIRDFYHRYTVDEHTLIAVREIERLAGPDCPDARFATLLDETPRPELLVLALLLHDIGKGGKGSHEEAGAALAQNVLGRFGFDRRDSEDVLFLVRNHLAMSEVMLKRDVEDRTVLHRFATRVSNPDRLRLLTLVTYADVTAVGPGTLTAWKRDLLWQLYVGAHRQLTIEYGAERISESDLRDRLSGSLAHAEHQESFRAFLEGFPLRYLETTEGDEIYRHFQMAMRLEPGGVRSRLVQRRHHWELWVVTADQARLFARIAGLLSFFEMNIVRARGFGNRQGLVLDSFLFEDPRGLLGRQRWEQQRLQKELARVVSGTVSVQSLLSRKEGSAVFPALRQELTPSVRFESDAGARETIVEIVASDAMGLLYRISQPMADLGCDVELALVSTVGQTASDVFYLRHRGAKLSADLEAELRRRILTALEGEQP